MRSGRNTTAALPWSAAGRAASARRSRGRSPARATASSPAASGRARSQRSGRDPLIEPVLLDVTDETSVAALIDRCERIDALVNCAGTLIRQGGEFEIANFQRVLDVNLTGTMRMCVAARPKLAAARGAIVNTASMYSFFGAPHAPAYAASKGGVAQLTKSLAVAWAPEGIRVNALAPGWIATELTKPARADTARSQAIVGRTPMARWGEPEEVAGAALYLLSDAARFVTGTILPVDGGYLTA